MQKKKKKYKCIQLVIQKSESNLLKPSKSWHENTKSVDSETK